MDHCATGGGGNWWVLGEAAMEGVYIIFLEHEGRFHMREGLHMREGFWVPHEGEHI